MVPVTTAGLAAVDAVTGPEFGRLMAIYERIKANYVDRPTTTSW
jgi:carboxyl-terminal processing protease